MQTNETLKERITRMELYFDTITQAVRTDAKLLHEPPLSAMLRKLRDYYTGGQWLSDYEAYERGELPRNCKCGVLSQDGVHDLLCEIKEKRNDERQEMNMIQGIHHISMKCQNEEEYRKVRSFYTQVLRLSVIKECDACILLDTGAGVVEIFRDGTESLTKGVIRHVAFAVEDVQACVDAVTEAGYEVFIAPKTVQIGGDAAFPATIAFCYGPLGEEIEFFCQGW